MLLLFLAILDFFAFRAQIQPKLKCEVLSQALMNNMHKTILYGAHVSGIWCLNETKVEELLYLLVFDWSLEVNDDLGIKNRLHVLECGPGALPGSVAFLI